MNLFFIGFALFLIFEKKIKSTMLFKKVDQFFLASEWVVYGQTWNLSLLTFYILCAYLVIVLFAWAILSNNLPYKEIQILRYLFYIVFLVIVIGVCLLTHIFIKVIRKIAE